jgi:hypothetical protein
MANYFNSDMAAVAAASVFPIGVSAGMPAASEANSSTPTAQTVSASTAVGPTIPWTPVDGTPQTFTFTNFVAIIKAITDRRATRLWENSPL